MYIAALPTVLPWEAWLGGLVLYEQVFLQVGGVLRCRYLLGHPAVPAEVQFGSSGLGSIAATLLSLMALD